MGYYARCSASNAYISRMHSAGVWPRKPSVTPDTLMVWRKLIAMTWAPASASGGRPGGVRPVAAESRSGNCAIQGISENVTY